MLSAVKAVNFVDEQQRAAAGLPPFARRLEYLAQIGNSGKHRRQRLEFEVGAVRQQARDRRLPAAGRAPQDQRRQLSVCDHPPDRAVGAEQVILTDNLSEAFRPQPVGQRARRLVLE